MKIRSKIILVIIFVAIIAVLIIASLRQGKSQTITVQVSEAERGELYHKVSGPGRIQPKDAIRISANVSAKIVKMSANEGHIIKKNKVLVQLDRTKLEAAVIQARANLNSAKTAVDKQKINKDLQYSEYSRKKQLYEKGLLSDEQIESSRTQYKLADATFREAKDQVVHAQGYLDQALDDLDKTTLRSPINGTVTKVNKKEGEIALGSQFQEDVILIVSNLKDLEAVIKVDENDVMNISLGDSAVIKIDALPDTSFHGKVSEIAHISNTRGLGAQDVLVSFEVKVTVCDTIFKARSGMSANVDIITDERKNSIKIPIQAVTIRKKDDIDFALNPEKSNPNDTTGVNNSKTKKDDKMEEVVFVINENQAQIRRVTTGIIGETDIEIRAGLDQGDKVVIGNYRALSRELRHNSFIKIKQ